MPDLKPSLFLVAAVLAAPAVASAEPLRDADRVHDLHSSDRLTPVTTVAFSMGYQVVDDDAALALVDPAILGFDVSAHLVSDAGLGGYFVLPLSFLSTDDVVVAGFPIAEGDSTVEIGNIEVGGLYASKLGRRVDLISHVGIALPTADVDTDELLAVYQPLASTPRYGDLVQRWPNTSWLRVGVSPMGTSGPLFWRADLGLDIMLDDDDNVGVDISPILRVNFAAGIDLGPADLSAELVTNVSDPEDDNADETASTFTLGARFQGASVQPGIALIIPVGFEGAADAIDMGVAFSLVGRVK